MPASLPAFTWWAMESAMRAAPEEGPQENPSGVAAVVGNVPLEPGDQQTQILDSRLKHDVFSLTRESQ